MDHIVAKDYYEVGGRFVTFNHYNSTFDPQDPVDFKYLVFVIIFKGSLKVFLCLKEIFAPIGPIVD